MRWKNCKTDKKTSPRVRGEVKAGKATQRKERRLFIGWKTVRWIKTSQGVRGESKSKKSDMEKGEKIVYRLEKTVRRIKKTSPGSSERGTNEPLHLH